MTSYLDLQSSDSLAIESFDKLRPTKLIVNPKKEAWLTRYVKWLKADRQGVEKIAVSALKVLQIAGLSCSVAGLIPLKWAIDESKRLDLADQFFKQAACAQQPSSACIDEKTKTRTFNHVYDFALEDGIIWYRFRQDCQGKWKPIFFDGYPNLIPQEIDSDGANLVAIDQNGDVHYKKVLREFRLLEIPSALRQKIEQELIDLEPDAYIAVDKAEHYNWKENWFSLPYFRLYFFVNLLTGKRLRIPSDTIAWSISHRGLYQNTIQDRLNRSHQIEGGTTTLFALDRNKRDIFKHDPWSPQMAKMSIPLPETADSTFEAEEIDASASTLMVIGYQKKKQAKEEVAKVITYLVDLDIIGWNPLFERTHQYTYSDHPPDEKAWALPFPSWQEHPLALQTGDFITKRISILQTGEGNLARQLRLYGVRQGQRGCYFKNIDEEEWHFKPEEGEPYSLEEAFPLTRHTESPFETTVHDYEAVALDFPSSFSKEEPEEISAKLSSFGQRSLHAKLQLTIQGKPYSLDLYTKKTLKNFFGIGSSSYDLVIPDSLAEEKDLFAYFQGKSVISVHIENKQGKVIMTLPSGLAFTFVQQD
ncbi:hypothetical protein [Candidatus Protochlamydia phocaeensis]|uniref:hypothetical protein n=1 Tax=Candidatus Protochlamydia phocaeensis TaxID=1414722 RepID=UPI0008396BF9|nr:hypothetical protein [Candidatus Protochlamydia phocaeensis]